MVSTSPAKFKEKVSVMSTIILGIHGLGNKPPKKLLARWWHDALADGLRAIGHPKRFFRFKLVYWAHHLYPKPLDPDVKDKKNPLYVDTPYVPASPVTGRRPENLRTKVLNYIERQLYKIILAEDLSLNYASVTDLIIRRYFRDLDIYYTKQCRDSKNNLRQARDVIRDDLARALRKYKRKDILLIGHSMGSIIAYDVLTQSVPDIRIHTLVTMGSPLGLPVVMRKILSEQRKKPQKHITVSTPANIAEAWYNFSDPQDKVATQYNLSEDYEPNSRHISTTDIVVHNDYQYGGKHNPHCVYGYLETPAVSHVIHDFLNAGRPKVLNWVRDEINYVLGKVREHKQ
jgi:pimeloyl-ACP methyl ester carboxylesterase